MTKFESNFNQILSNVARFQIDFKQISTRLGTEFNQKRSFKSYQNIVEEGSVACLVLGTESSSVYILDPEAFTIMDSLALPSPPVFLTAAGTGSMNIYIYIYSYLYIYIYRYIYT